MRKQKERTDTNKRVGRKSVDKNITERHRADIGMREESKKLRQLSSELETIIDSIPNLVFYKDTNNRFIRVNKYMADAYGMTKMQLEGKSLFDLHSPEEAQAYHEDDLQVIRSGQPRLDIDEPWETKEGIRWVNTSKIPYRNEKGEVIGVIGVSKDITERKKMEEELRKHHEHLEELVAERTIKLEAEIAERTLAEEALRENLERFDFANRATFNAIWDWDLQTNELGWNENFQLLFGYGADEIESGIESWTHRIHSDDLERVETSIHAAIDSGKQSWSDHYRFRRKDGLYAEVEDRGYISRDTSGKPIRMIGAMHDDTERKHAEEALREANDNLERRVLERTLELARGKQLLDQTGKLARVGGWEIDIKTNTLTWTDMVYEIHEIGRDYKPTVEAGINFYAPEAIPVISEAVRLAIEEGRPFDVELQLITAKKNRLWVRALGGAVRENGEIVRVGGAFQDINERKLVQDELKRHRDHLEELVKERTEKLAVAIKDLERSNKELEQFAYVASHDLQEPLRMVSSFTQLLAQRYEGQLDEKAKKYIDYAVDGAVRMQRLINDLLTYSRVGTRGKPLESIDSHSVLGEALLNLQSAIEESRALVTNDDLPTVRVDASQLAQVFQNLIANAIKFRGETSPRIHVSAQDRGREWIFSIRDNGIGIDPQYKDRIFVIFQRLHTKQEYPGTGIGLALCKRIVERHGGSIWFESEPGKGSTFFFSIPK